MKNYNQYTGFKYTKDEIINKCRQCSSKSEFRDSGIYSMAKKHNILDICNEIMEVKTEENKKQYEENMISQIEMVIHKHKTITEFKSNYPKLYYYIRTNKLKKYLNLFIRQRFSTPQQICKLILESLLKTECMYNNRSILNGKELDIYFNTYKLGCEYNGYYWHKNNTIKDNEKLKLCQDQNIHLIVISEPTLNEYLSFEKAEIGIKSQIKSELPKINSICKTNFLEVDVDNIIIDRESIFKNLYNKSDIEYVLNKCTKLSEIKNKYNKIWQYIHRYNLTHLLDGVKTRNYIYMQPPEFINYVVSNFKTYTEFTKHKSYLLATKRKLLNDIKLAYQSSKSLST